MKTFNLHLHLRRTTCIACLGLLMTATAGAQPSDLPLQKYWRTDGPVHAIVVEGNTVYIGGQFQYVGPHTGGAGILNATTAAAKPGFPEVVGTVNTAVPDGEGGWFMGGDFSSVGGIVRSNVAHILSDTRVDSNWNVPANGAINALVLQGNTIYLGGAFTLIRNQTRNRLAALDLKTGELKPWNPNANNTVSALAFSDDTVYVGGNFATIGGQSRSRLASVEAGSGLIKSWNPGVSSGAAVSTVVISGSTVYVGGSFTTAGGKPRNRIAALSTTSNTALDWNPNASAPVEAIAVVGDVIYAGGQFTSIGSANRNHLAALDRATFTATDWDPNVDGVVHTLVVSTNTVLAGGTFATVGGKRRNTLAAIDAITGQVTEWEPLISSLRAGAARETTSLAQQADDVFVGSTFASIGGVIRSNIAALDIRTGEATDWDPRANGAVRALAVIGNQVYAGGTFTNIGGIQRRRLAGIDRVTAAPTSWNPDVLGRSTVGVFALLADSDRLFVGGNFTNILGNLRLSIAAINLSTGDVLPWNPGAQASSTSVSASVNAMAAAGDTLYAGGDFVTFGGQSRARLAAILANTFGSTATAWNPGADKTVQVLVVDGTKLYVGGAFALLGGQTRNRVGAVALDTGSASGWNPDAGTASANQVRAIRLAGQSIYVGGVFSSLGGEFRNQVAGLRLANGQAHAWNPNANAAINVIYQNAEALYVGGEFTSLGGNAHAYFAVFSTAPGFIPGSVELADGNFKADLRTGEGARLITQVSTDLVNWTSISTNTPAGAPIPVSYPLTAVSPSVFYRAVMESD